MVKDSGTSTFLLVAIVITMAYYLDLKGYIHLEMARVLFIRVNFSSCSSLPPVNGANNYTKTATTTTTTT